MNQPTKLLFALTATAVFGIVLYVWDAQETAAVENAKFETRTRPADTSAPRPPEPEQPCKTIGQICAVKRISDSTDLVLAAVSLPAYNEMEKALRARDKEGMAQMAMAQQVIGPKIGDRLRVLDISHFAGRIEGRFISGEHSGRKVWIPVSSLKATD